MKEQRKRILFINRYFHVGGIQSSLINMANELCEDYDVDMLVYYPEGVLRERLDSRINIIKPSWPVRAMGMSPKEAFRSKNPFIFLFRTLGAIWARIFDNRLPIWFATRVQPKIKGYDLAIAYRAETRKKVITSGYVRILDRCVLAKNKAVWVHYDANTLNNSSVFNEKYYKNIDKIVGVSRSVMNAFGSISPNLTCKTDYCYNFLNYKSMFEKAEKEQETEYLQNKFICFSACRLSEEKGIVRGISALASLLKENEDVLWYIAGDGPERENIEAAIRAADLDGRVILLGNLSNPYPYMKNADLYLSLSFHEAAPMVYKEAKALHVPVFSTRTSSSDEMLNDGVQDFICENSEKGITEKFSEIMKDRQTVINAKANLKSYCGSNEESLKKLAEWIE